MNFISITFDDLNAFAFLKSLYGGRLHTPNLDRVMQVGTTFENAYASVAVCNASRTSVLSGLDPAVSGIHFNYQLWSDRLDPSGMLPAILKNEGYFTSLIGKVFHESSMAQDVQQALADFYFRVGSAESGDPLQPRPSELPLEQQADYLAVDQVIAQLAMADPATPFAMFAGLLKPHPDWIVPQEYLDLYPLEEIVLPFSLDGDLADVPESFRELLGIGQHGAIERADAWEETLQGYFASISFADAMLGRILDALEANGQMENTAILVWTDHGYHLGDKDQWGKFTLWEEAVRAPMVLALPGTEDDGQRVAQPVELVDIMPTILELLGISPPQGLSGRSLLPFINDPSLQDDGVAISTMYGSASIRSGDWRYTRYADGSTELYNLADDPNQWANLALDAAWSGIREQLDVRLRAELASDGWLWIDAGFSLDGGDGAEAFILAPGAGTVAGGDGDDIYFIHSADAVLREQAGGGLDRVFSSVSYTLPDHIENLEYQIRGDQDEIVLTGNGLANEIVGSGLLLGLDGNDVLKIFGAGEADGGAGDDQLNGSSARDRLWGRGGDDRIVAGDGQDTLEGGTGDDHLSGGRGDDTILGGSGNDELFGDAGIDTASYASAAAGVIVDLREYRLAQDTVGAGWDKLRGFENLIGSDFDDQLIADRNANSVFGGAGADLIITGEGDDLLDGGAGVDILWGGAGHDVYFIDDALDAALESFGGGWDEVRTTLATYVLADALEKLTGLSDTGQTLVGNTGVNILVGGQGDDILNGRGGLDTMRGGAGDDTYVLGAGAETDVVIELAGQGNDTVSAGIDYVLTAHVENLTLLGDARNGGGNNLANTIVGNDLDNALEGGGGSDALYGRGGHDRLRGDDGDDILIDGAGDDLLLGGDGDDMLFGGDGEDILNGQAGNDTLKGQGGNDLMAGRTGDDTYYVTEAGDVVEELANQGRDTIFASVNRILDDNLENLVLTGFARSGLGNALANRIAGNELANGLSGLAGDDVLFGYGGADTLNGGGGRDTLDGGSGADLIEGGEGEDRLAGGEGRDVFRFREGDTGSRRAWADLIVDFSQADNEKINLQLIDSKTGVVGNQAFNWIGDRNFTGVAGQLHYVHHRGATYVEGDTDGDREADFFIALSGMIDLTAADFVL